jgi:hypothetical protein
VVLLASALGGSLLGAMLDPELGFNRASLALVLGLLAALVICSSVYDVARARWLQHRHGVSSTLRAYPAGMAIAAVLVAFSRIVDFQPGFLLGVFTGLGFSQQVEEEDDGRALAVASGALLGAGVLCWLLWSTVSELAAGPSPTFGVLFLDAALSTIWIAGVQGVMFGLMPLKFLDGAKVLHWNRLGWAVIYGFGMFAFVHTMLRPGSQVEDQSAFIAAMLLFALFCVISVGFWAYFRFRSPRPDPSDEPGDDPGDPPPPAAERELVDA